MHICKRIQLRLLVRGDCARTTAEYGFNPRKFWEFTSKYQQALSQKIQKAQIDITNLSCDKITDIIQIKKQPTRIFFLSEEVTHPIIEHCRVIDILNWAKEDSNFTVCQQITSLCTYIQHHGIEVFKNLSPRAGGYLSQSHVLCDIVASIAFTLDNVPPTLDNIPPEVHLIKETFIDACKKTFASSRQTSYGFGPSQNKHKANAIVIRGTRRDSDIKESHEQYTDGDSISDNLLAKILIEISEDTYTLLVKYGYQSQQLSMVARTVALLFCPDPDRHKLVWDTCLIPVFKSGICTILRGKLDEYVLIALEHGKENIWDNGTAARW